SITNSLLTHHGSVATIWVVQVGAIVVAHCCAVVVAHQRALRFTTSRSHPWSHQLPAAAAMIAYTTIGLWLLSSPTAG
ncbi:MAG: hypothetical protein K0U93_14025, partial [Gammaproteobacteria bacterium]|nr:hypothetical protein [Gammaproteobacteria bacterium]